tara:strand:+ start:667 stop:786 length:120 start_codon:yes stop_codon:yes gene_type:complete
MGPSKIVFPKRILVAGCPMTPIAGGVVEIGLLVISGGMA